MAINREINGYKVTDEQDIAVSEAQKGSDLVLFALAGAGKTSTLKAIAKYYPKKTLYIVFNTSIAKEAQGEFPRHVDCRTAHSLAFDEMIKASVKMREKFKAANNGNKLSSDQVKATLNITNGSILNIKSFQLEVAITRTLEAFLRSADDKVLIDHVSPKVIGWANDVDKRHEIMNEVRKYTQKLWDAMKDPNNPMGITHDGYLKAYQLSNPKINADLIMVDEAQDSNPVLLAIIKQQKCQKIFVGDPNQAIYGWRGAVDAMDLLKGVKLALSKSFRFGKNIADIANVCLNWKDKGMTIEGLGNPKKPEGKAVDVWLCRTNMSIFSKAIIGIDNNKKVYIEGGVEAVAKMIEGAYHLKNGNVFNCRAPELIEFASWTQLVTYADEAEDVDLKRLIKFIEIYKERTPMAIHSLRQSVNIAAGDADIILSTAHKAKGLEWDKVSLADDFKLPNDKDEKGNPIPFYDADMNLLYVAVTRAKREIVLTAKQKEFLLGDPDALLEEGNRLAI